MRRLLTAFLSVALLGLMLAGSARACSCAPVKAGEALREADAAVVGRLVKVVPRGATWADYRYRVQGVYKGAKRIARGRTISVRSARSSAACALPRGIGRRYGLFLTRAGGRWHSGGCAVISPGRMRAAARRDRQGRRLSQGASAAGCPS